MIEGADHLEDLPRPLVARWGDARPRHGSRHPPTRALVGALLVLLAGAFSFALVMVRTGAWRAVPVTTGAMRPDLPAGALAIAEREPASALAVHDVVLVRPRGGGASDLQRIVAIHRSGAGEHVTTKVDHGTRRGSLALGGPAPSVYVVRFALSSLGSVGGWVRSVGGSDLLLGLLGLDALLLGAWFVLLRRPGAHSRRRARHAGPIAAPDAASDGK